MDYMHLLCLPFLYDHHQPAYSISSKEYIYIVSNAFLPMQMYMSWMWVHWIDIMYCIWWTRPYIWNQLNCQLDNFISAWFLETYHTGKCAGRHTMKYKPHSFPIHSSLRVHRISNSFFISIFSSLLLSNSMLRILLQLQSISKEKKMVNIFFNDSKCSVT